MKYLCVASVLLQMLSCCNGDGVSSTIGLSRRAFTAIEGGTVQVCIEETFAGDIAFDVNITLSVDFGKAGYKLNT